MHHISLIGIGTGSPDHVTHGAVHALNAADAVLIPRKGVDKADLAGLRRDLCARLLTNPATRLVEVDLPVRDPAIPDYRARVEAWHDAIAAAWAAALAPLVPAASRVALLVWGDPSLYDSTLRIAARLNPAPRVEVIPGITALQALTAAHAIPLNALAGPVTVTTGRRLRAGGWPAGADRVAVMLDEGGAFTTLDPAGVRIWWGAMLGLPQQALEAGPLAEAGPRILATRAALRAAHGWVMDVYLLAKDGRAG